MNTVFHIVTPSYNAITFLDDAILSVITQSGDFIIYYHVQDGGSTDGTVERLKEWQRILSGPTPFVRCKKLVFTWNSAPDSGMYQALNRGFAALDVPDEGIMAWVNTDDQYLPHAFSTAAGVFADIPALRWVGGTMFIKYGSRLKWIISGQPYPPELVRAGCCDNRCWRYLNQSPMFWRGSLWKQAGPLNEQFRYAGDYELWTRFARYEDFACLPLALSVFAYREEQLCRRRNADGVLFYEEEEELVRPLRERQRFVQAFWKKRIRPPKAPAILMKEDRYTLCEATAWPTWGIGWAFYRYRLRYYMKRALGLWKPAE